MTPRIPIFNMFGPSPVRTLELHMDKVNECAEQLLPFFENAFTEQWSEAKAIFDKINRLENDADSLKKEFRQNFHKDLYLPVPRSELLHMLMLQDRIANKAKDLAGLALNRKMILPEVIQTTYKVLLQRCVDAINKTHEAINELDELLEAGFKGNAVKVVITMLDELDSIEHETDVQQRAIRKSIFQVENEIPPINCIFLYKMIEWTGDLADRSHSVGGQLQILLAQ